jgi:FKBP-type peptidyl-prolyl cis-trans isomerase SlyD
MGMQLEARYKGESKIVTVTGIDDSGVTLDGNHPLAGKTMEFDVTVVDVRDATPEEIQHGQPFISTGCHSGCGCGCEEDSCDDGCEGGHCH